VGVIGAITPRLPNISSPRNVVVDADVAGAVNAEAAMLIEQGVNRIILVSHLQGLGEDRELVPQLSGVDIVVAGGGDELLKNEGDTCQTDESAVAPYPLVLTDADGNEVPVVTAPGGYRCIGRLEVTFDADGAVASYEGASIGVPLDGDAEEFATARVEEPLALALAELDATVIGQSHVELDGRRNSVRTSASNVGELLADALLAAGRNAVSFGGQAPVVAIQNGGGIRNDAVIPPGEITEADTFDIAPFANFVVIGSVPRERLKDMLEVAVAGLPEAEGTFPQIAGFSMTVETSKPGREVNSDGDCALNGDAGSRVRDMILDDGTQIVSDGQVIPGEDIALATIDFLADGGDCYPLADLDFIKVGASYQQALSSFITDDLSGNISESDYPLSSGRISISGTDTATNDAEADDDAHDGSGAGADDADNAAIEDSNDNSASNVGSETSDELPNTGLNSLLFVIIAITVVCAGGLVYVEAQRTGWLSLTNRLSATRAWFHTDNE
jgi:5'-nucleotidase